MPTNIVMANLDPQPVKGNSAPLIATDENRRDGSRVVDPVSSGPGSGGIGSISWSGVIAHGQTLTIEDEESRFGARSEVKPLYVQLGGQRGGSSLGRDTGDYWVSAVTVSSEQSLGQITQPLKRDFAIPDTGNASFDGLPFIFGGQLTPFIQYCERYYDFLNNAAGTNSNGSLNLKTNRWWGAGITNPNAFSGYQFSDGASGNIRMYVEYPQTSGPSAYYSGNRPFVGREWQSDEYILQQSSGLGVADGHLIHIWNGAEVNGRKDDWVTRNATYPGPIVQAHLDQISNGVGEETAIFYGYQCWDTEYNGVYIGDAPTRSECSKLVRQPQTAWSPSQVAIHLVETHVPLSGAYLYFRTGLREWVSEEGVQIG